MNSNDIKQKLSRLTGREREVLSVYCRKMPYWKIGEELALSEGTIKVYMHRISAKLELDAYGRHERKRILLEQFCPVLSGERLDEPPEQREEDDIFEPLSEEEEQQIDELEYPLAVWEQEPIQSVGGDQAPRRRNPLRGLTCGLMLGVVVVGAGIYGLWRAGLIQFGGTPDSVGAQETQLASAQTPTGVEPAPSSIDAEPDEEESEPSQTPQTVATNTATSIPPSATSEQVTGPPAVTLTLPYQDTFDLRMRDEWQPLIGSWRVVNGHLTTDPDGDWVRILTGVPGWTNYAVDVDVWADDWFYPVQIIVREQDAGYLAVEINIHNTDFNLHTGGEPVTIAHSDVGIVDHLESGGRYERVYHLRVEVDGDIFTAYIDGNRVLQVQDSSFAWGRVGLAFRTPYDPHWFDNFRVSALP